MNICSDPVLFIGGVRHPPDEAKCRRGGEFLVTEVAGPCRELELVDLRLLHILEHQRKLLWVWLDRETIGFGSSFKITPAAKPTDPSPQRWCPARSIWWEFTVRSTTPFCSISISSCLSLSFGFHLGFSFRVSVFHS